MKKVVYYLLFLIFFSCATEYEEKFYDNGNLQYRVELVDGKRQGELKKYNEDGSLQYISHWDQGEKNGEAKLFFRDGKVKLIEYFRNGTPEGQVQEFDSLGNLIRTMNFGNGKQLSDSSYYQSGRLEGAVHFKEDSIIASYFFETGELEEFSVKYKDQLVYAKKYDPSGKLVSSNIPISTNFSTQDKIASVTFEIPYSNCHDCSFLIIINDIMGNEINRQYFDSLEGEILLKNFESTEQILKGLLYEIDSNDVPQGFSPFDIEIEGKSV
ncbi:MAG: hypothetical protein AAF693_21050 [Bacteroidota bacterium]